MFRVRKIIILFFIFLLFIIAGVFYWRNQADVRELNKGLPEGIKVTKSLSGRYAVVNRIDGYEFRIPEEWKGIREIEYLSERIEEGYTASSIGIEGREGGSRIISVDRFKTEELDSSLDLWAKDNFDTFGLIGDFTSDKIGEFNVVKTQEEVHLMGMYIYFFRENSTIYAITCGSEEFIREIIIDGKW